MQSPRLLFRFGKGAVAPQCRSSCGYSATPATDRLLAEKPESRAPGVLDSGLRRNDDAKNIAAMRSQSHTDF